MDSLLLVGNNVSSFLVVMGCWWLVHAYRADGGPYGLPIAIGWGLLGISVMVTGFARNLMFDPNAFIVLTKFILFAICLMTARRFAIRHRNRRPRPPAGVVTLRREV